MSGATQSIETKVDELGSLTRQFMKQADEQRDATKARASELDASMQKINARLDEIETKASRPGQSVGGGDEEKSAREFGVRYAKAFEALLRKGVMVPDEFKALSTDSNPDGGYLVPSNMSNTIGELLVELSPIRSYATVQSISQGDTWEEPIETATVATVSTKGERVSPSETITPTLDMLKIVVHECYAEPRVTQKMLDDSGINIEAWLSKKVGQRFAVQEAGFFVNGTGVGQPEGIITNANVEVVDGAVSASIDHDDMLTVMAELPEFYALRAAFFMKRATKFSLRKLTGGDGQYLWQPSLQIGTPPTYDGHSVVEAIDMAALGASAKAVIFGDLREGYKIIDRAGITVLRDNLTAKPYTKFYTTRRVGGRVVKAEAIKILRCAA